MDLFIVDIPLWAILSLLTLTLAYVYSTRNFSVWSNQGINGPKPWPFIGNGFDMFSDSLANVDQKYIRKYGKIVGTYFGSQPALLVSDPEFLRLAMIKEFSSMPNRREARFSGVFNSFLTVIRDDHWKHVRSALTPTFTTGKLKQMQSLINDCGNQLVEHIDETSGEPFSVKKFSAGYTMDVIARTAFGIEVDSQKNPDSLFLKYGGRLMGNVDKKWTFWEKFNFFKILAIMFVVPSSLWPILEKIGINLTDRESADYFVEIINKILENRNIEESKRKDFVQLCMNQLAEANDGDPDTHVSQTGAKWTTKGLTKNEIVANALIFFLAGFETTAASLQFLFYELAMNPDKQEKLYEEIKAHCKSDNPSYEEIAKVDYLDWCIEESLRLYPPAMRFDRQVDREVTINDVTLPKGSLLMASGYTIHHNPEIWPNPEKFLPERFSPENKEGRHPCAWIPFGIGNRNCIGMRLALLEMKVAVIKVLFNFKIEKTEDTPAKPFKLKRAIFLAPDSLIHLRATRRHSE